MDPHLHELRVPGSVREELDRGVVRILEEKPKGTHDSYTGSRE